MVKCDICRRSWDHRHELSAHLQSDEHFLEHVKCSLWTNEEPLLRNKSHVKVSCLTTKTCVPAVYIHAELHRQVRHTMRVQVSSASQSSVLLQSCSLLELDDTFCLEHTDKISHPEKPVSICPGSTYDVVLSCTVRTTGVKRTGVVFKFCKDAEKTKPFVIVRFFELVCQDDPSEHSVLEPQIPYEYRLPVPRLPDAQNIIPLDCTGRARFRQEYEVPAVFKKFHKHGLKPWSNITDEQLGQLQDTLKNLNAPLSKDSYYQSLRALLYLEEVQMNVDIRTYDMINVVLQKCGSEYAFEVPGATEGRPSVMKGNRLFIRSSLSNPTLVTEYEAVVRKTDGTYITVEVTKKFNDIYIKGMRFDVRFTFNRVPLMRMHRALDSCKTRNLWSFIFPNGSSSPSKPALELSDLRFFNKKVQENREQSKAVSDMLLGLHRPYPYLLFGPPGTGKTVTLVEAIKQICTLIPSSRILITAPSNSASDLLAERLLDNIMPSQMLRLYSSSVHPDKISKKLKRKKCCNYVEADIERRYEAPELMEYRIIVATLVTSSKLVSAGLPPGYFTHVIVDEAGHALEPECVIPLMGFLNAWKPDKSGPGGHIILAGDPMQLGPVIRNRLCSSYNLGVSLLERLIKMPSYQQNDENYAHMMTKLLRNFRSHADILKVPNEMFYNNELKVFADEMITQSMLTWDGLPTKGVPLLFHGVCGKDMREGNNPSYFNPDEVKIVVDYVISLLGRKNGVRTKVRESDIGIVSPYRKQVLKIRSLLEKRGHKDVSVGSTEEFQGQERLVIIITTVRSNRNLVQGDVRHNLGFLQNPKRFNVALTRAKGLMVIVGNPYTLSEDPCWNRILEFCVAKKAYRGLPYKPIKCQPKVSNVSKPLLEKVPDETGDNIVISQKTLQEEPRWRQEL